MAEIEKYEEERQALLQELDFERKRLVEVFDRAPAFMAILQGTDHVFEIVNPAYYQLIGHRNVIGKPVLEALPELQGQGFMEILDDVLASGTPFVGNEMKIQLQRQPNVAVEERYVNFVYEPLNDPKGRRVGIFAHGYDLTDQVTARQRAEGLILQVEHQARAFDATLKAIKDFVYTFDIAGRFTYANSPLLDLLGITLDEIVGKTFHELPYPEALATTLESHIAHVAVTGMPVTDETPYTSQSGYAGYYEYIFTPVFDKDGVVVLVAGSTRDITHRKQLESQKDEFMAIVSHELKTPVTSIKAFTQVLQNRYAKSGDEKSSVLLGKMDAQINKLATLIEDLLDVTKIDGGELRFNEERVHVDDLVSEVVEEVQRTTSRHTIRSIGVSRKTVLGDKNRIGQVLINLLTNAIKYSPKSDTIIIRTTGDNEHVSVCVQDFGIGIPKDKQAHVFERFYRVSDGVDNTMPGIGLGLYISSEIVRRQGGRISVESEPGKGSTFCATLPCSTQEDTAAEEHARHG